LKPNRTAQSTQANNNDCRNNRLRSGFAGVLVLSAIVAFEARNWFAPAVVPVADNPAEETVVLQPVSSVFAERRVTDPTYPLPGFIAKQLPAGSYQRQRDKLISQAAAAVANDNRLELGNRLALLGAASLADNDLDGARVYLEEALSIYEEESDAIGIGSVELLRGRVETVARENARDAASAHDIMQITAWKITKNRFEEAEIPLRSAIDENVRLKRFGAAAAGYEMLAHGQHSIGNRSAAESAAAEAIRLHAASGREKKAQQLLTQLQLLEIRRARDYEQVYRRLVNAGDPVQAWQFRQKANHSLALASKRAMHRRQTGIVALLYNSNDNRQAARDSLARARAMFTAESREDLVNHINSAEQQVW